MTACATCGHDPEAVELQPLFSDEAAEDMAAAEVEAAETYAENQADEREHVETLAETHEAAETERTQILADAAVAIAEADAAADVAIAEAEAEEAEHLADAAEALTEAEDDEPAAEPEDEDVTDDEDQAADEGVTPVAVPPQPDDGQRPTSDGSRAARRPARWRRHRR